MSAEQEYEISKFGGTSVADYESMFKSATIITNNPNAKVVVLSASAGITNLLIALSEGREKTIREQHIAKIKSIQDGILTHLKQPEKIKEEINQLILSISYLSEAASLATSSALTDELVSHGEMMSSLLFTEILKELSIDAVWCDARKFIRTDDQFGGAVPLIDEIQQLACAHLKSLPKDQIIVTQGFIGSEATGKTTTLGRGGSDYTAAILGEALNATKINIWTDVAGIYTTDPRIVPNAKKIDEISFSEAAEMATFGAKVLHPATMIPAIRCNIPVFVGSSKAPEQGGTTVFNAKCSEEEQPVFRALALRKKQTLLTLHSLNMLHAQGFLANVFTILAKHNISVDLVTTSEVSIAITIDTAGTKTDGKSLLTQSLLNELSTYCSVHIQEDLVLVAIIGNSLTTSKNMAKTVFEELDNINIHLVSFGASTHNLCFLVKENDANDTIRRLHQHLFE